MNKKHKHAELIKAWADGAEIEAYYPSFGAWEYQKHPAWHQHFEYRIKPEPKPDIVRYAEVLNVEYYKRKEKDDANLKLTFDGETGELKSAEVLK